MLLMEYILVFFYVWEWLYHPGGGCSALARRPWVFFFCLEFRIFQVLACKFLKTDASIRQDFSLSTPSFCEKCRQNTSVASESGNGENASGLKTTYKNCGNLLRQQLFVWLGEWSLAKGWVCFRNVSKGKEWDSEEQVAKRLKVML